MANNFRDTLETNSYFKTLPAYVQETIKQSSMDINSEEELRRCAEKLMRNS